MKRPEGEKRSPLGQVKEVELVLRYTDTDDQVRESAWKINPFDLHISDTREVLPVFEVGLANFGGPDRLEVTRGSHRIQVEAQVLGSPLDPPTPDNVEKETP